MLLRSVRLSGLTKRFIVLKATRAAILLLPITKMKVVNLNMILRVWFYMKKGDITMNLDEG